MVQPVIKKNAKGQFIVSYIGENGKQIGRLSETYHNRKDCLHAHSLMLKMKAVIAEKKKAKKK